MWLKRVASVHPVDDRVWCLEYEKDVSWERVTHIFTDDLPCYFALLSRVHQQKQPVGPAGAVVHSHLIPSISVAVPPGSQPPAAPLTMEVRSTLCATLLHRYTRNVRRIFRLNQHVVLDRFPTVMKIFPNNLCAAEGIVLSVIIPSHIGIRSHSRDTL